MKKNLRFLAVLIFSLLCLAVFAGCSDISEDAYVFDSTSTAYETSIKNITIRASSKTGMVRFTSSARSLVPGAFSSSELNFYIGGQNLIDNSKLTVQKVIFEPSESSANVGTITVPFNSYNYQFVLAAVPATSDSTIISTDTYIESILDYAVLSGVAAADLRYSTGNTTVNFYLTSDGLKGKGGFDIKLYLKDWSDESKNAFDAINNWNVLDKVEVALYKLEAPRQTLDGAVSPAVSFSSRFSEDTAYRFEASGITPKCYELVVTFSRDGKNYDFSDKIFILPCQTTTATIGIPDVLDNEPEAPANLKQGYVAPESEDSNYFKTVFTWTDNSNTESNFEIQLMDVSSNENVLASTVDSLTNAELETLWAENSTVDNTFSYDENFYGKKIADDTRPVWYAGNLGLNSEYAVFTMPLGKRYLARIRSVNPVGGSSWCYSVSAATSVNLPYGSTTAESDSLSGVKTLSAKAFSTKIVNLYRLAYYLADGAFTVPSIPTIYYFSQANGGNAIMIPDGMNCVAAYNSGNEIILKNGDLAWSHWAVNSVSGIDYPHVFTNCASGETVDNTVTYYVTKDITASPDVNGSIIGYEIANPQPAAHDGNYYIDTKVPVNYTNYKNLSLYAVYETPSSPVIIDDSYDMADNLNFSASANGTGTQPSLAIDEGDVIKIIRTDGNYITSSLDLRYNYKNGVTFVYDSVTLKLTKKGGTELANYSDSGQSFRIPLTERDAGSYTATMYASKSGKNYQYSFTIVLKDN